MSLLLVACVPTSKEDAIEKMEELGYSSSTVYDIGFTLLIKGLDTDAEATYCALDKDFNIIMAIWFKTSAGAKEFYNDMKEKMSDFAKDSSSKEGDEYGAKRQGKVVYAGSKQAMKDFASL
jgi:hypothetical protein